MGNNFLKNKNDYNKDKWEKINQEIPYYQWERKLPKLKQLNMIIDNKFTSGDGEFSFQIKSILETLIFKVKNF